MPNYSPRKKKKKKFSYTVLCILQPELYDRKVQSTALNGSDPTFPAVLQCTVVRTSSQIYFSLALWQPLRKNSVNDMCTANRPATTHLPASDGEKKHGTNFDVFHYINARPFVPITHRSEGCEKVGTFNKSQTTRREWTRGCCPLRAHGLVRITTKNLTTSSNIPSEPYSLSCLTILASRKCFLAPQKRPIPHAMRLASGRGAAGAPPYRTLH